MSVLVFCLSEAFRDGWITSFKWLGVLGLSRMVNHMLGYICDFKTK